MQSRADLPRIRRVRAAQVASVPHELCRRHRTSCDDTRGRNTIIARIFKMRIDIASLFFGPLFSAGFKLYSTGTAHHSFTLILIHSPCLTGVCITGPSSSIFPLLALPLLPFFQLFQRFSVSSLFLRVLLFSPFVPC